MVDERVQSTYYHPAKVSYWVRNYAHLVALAENPSTARNLLTNGPTPESPRPGTKQKGSHGDPHRYGDILADIKRALAFLCVDKPGSIEVLTVIKVSQGWSLSRVSTIQQIGKGRTLDAYNAAVKEMAVYLGWAEEVHTADC